MTVRASRKIEVVATLQRSDVHAMLAKAGMKPETFGDFWGVELKVLDEGGLQITFEEHLNLEPVPKLV